MVKLPLLDPIDFLVRQKFDLTSGSLNNEIYARWKGGQPLEPGARAVVAKIEAFRKELVKLPAADLDSLVRTARGARLREEELAHRFNRPPALADFEVYDFWSKAAYWEKDEAVALLLGRNPKVVNSKSIRSEHRQSLTIEMFNDISELLSRAMTARQIDFTLGPGGILAWAKRSGIEFPAELEAAVLRNGQELKDWKAIAATLAADVGKLKTTLSELETAPPPNKALGTREKEGYLKLIIGMAIDGYGYDPSEARSPLAGELSGNLQKLGISISDDTVRNYLKQAKELLPRDAPKDG